MDWHIVQASVRSVVQLAVLVFNGLCLERNDADVRRKVRCVVYDGRFLQRRQCLHVGHDDVGVPRQLLDVR